MPAGIAVKLDLKRLEEIRRNNPGRADQIVGTIAFDMEADLKANMSSGSPSSPGSPPAVDTGALKSSIHAERLGPMLWRVVDGVLYGVMLEFGTRKMRARPFFTPSAKRMEKKIASFFKAMV